MKLLQKTILGMATLAMTMAFVSQSQAQISATPDGSATSLVGQLLSLSGGAVTSNETLTASPDNVCSGSFIGGNTVGGGFLVDSGVILSSGDVTGISPPNSSDNLSVVLNTPGDPFLDSLIPGFTTFDACVLEFDFQCPQGSAGSNVAFQYNFTSEEYNEFVGSPFNDVFGWQLNGSNIAILPGTMTPVAINNVNNGLNSGFYNDNDPSDTAIPFNIEADGFVDTLTAEGSANLAVNHMKLAVGDAGDRVLDSWVMI